MFVHVTHDLLFMSASFLFTHITTNTKSSCSNIQKMFLWNLMIPERRTNWLKKHVCRTKTVQNSETFSLPGPVSNSTTIPRIHLDTWDYSLCTTGNDRKCLWIQRQRKLQLWETLICCGKLKAPDFGKTQRQQTGFSVWGKTKWNSVWVELGWFPWTEQW